MTPAAVLQRFEHRRMLRQAASVALETAEAERAQVSELSETAEAVQVFFAVLAEAERKALEQRVQALVDYGVQTVFGPDCRFQVTSDLRGKAVRTEFWLVEHGRPLSILDSTGGGIGDVVSFLLRVVMLCLTRPAQRRVLVLDEPFKFVSSSHFQTLTALLRELSESLDVQFIMVTHKPELLEAATTVVRVSRTGETSRADIEVL